MKEQNIDRKLKTELDLFKIYSVFLIAIITGFTSILYKIFDTKSIYNPMFLFSLLIITLILLAVILTFFFKSYNNIKNITKNQL